MLKQLVFLSLKMLLNVCILMRSLAGNKMYILWTSIPLTCFNIQVTPPGGGRGVIDRRHTKAGGVQSRSVNFVFQNRMQI